MSNNFRKDVVSGLLLSAGLFMILNQVFDMGQDLGAGLYFAAAWFIFAYWRFSSPQPQ